MKHIAFLLPFVFLLTLPACREAPVEATPVSDAPVVSLADRKAPDELFGELFRRVQMERIYPDGKTFVDMIPKASPEEIMTAYAAEKALENFELKSFVEEYFSPPVQPESGFSSDASRSISEHINTLWAVLTREAGADEGAAGSLLPLPNDYVVPGGRFREVYYWDSYFTMLGLQAGGEHQLIRDMVENFAYLIDEVGHIPNGNRTYYLTRSQPPFFSLMVEVLAEVEGPEVYQEFMPQLVAEHAFWMKGQEAVSETVPAVNHVVRMPDGSLLNRYFDEGRRPRAESYREDVLTIRESGRDSQRVARHLRSGAESGWDFSARWFADGKNISTIVTTDIIPPDLNSLLYKLETTIGAHHPDEQTAEAFTTAAENRRAAVEKYLWNEETGAYEDFNCDLGKFTGFLTLATVYPLFVELSNERRAAIVGELLAEKFLAPGGLRTSLVDTDQQWDAPNGWPPLQWMAYRGLKNYNENSVAEDIRQRWMDNNERVYENVTKMVEKYNVEDISLEAGGGEYPVQDGFGWSNGVYLRMAQEDARGIR
ncbi:alpha,alpha-trehalase TreF [Lewinella sp. W8]|uniref:alpha,alpha-trehalase TreF n=1 Tax=Lewinella sp. W8 TaxID=2528208 RepID=UPI0010675F5C|nr:alpha,alpha-trehalase TreF [Lewinella sp. W8]MTB50120.1 alpha,alpha-trehalase TreF [Lewinella sp. W8]